MPRVTKTAPATTQKAAAGRTAPPSPTRLAMDRATARANRRRAWPRWLQPLLRTVAITALLTPLAGGGWWLWQSGWVLHLIQEVRSSAIAASAGAGYTIAEITIEGRDRTGLGELQQALGVQQGDPIAALDLEAARSRIEALPWVASATVERRLPSTVMVRLEEHRAMAIWQHNGKHALIGRDGSVLTDQGAGQFPELPLVVGADAPAHTADLLVLLAGEPPVRKRVAAAIRVGSRRWDLRFDNGVTARLPESDVSTALHRLADTIEKDQLLERDIVAVDLRMPDRLVLQTVARPPETRKTAEGKT